MTIDPNAPRQADQVTGVVERRRAIWDRYRERLVQAPGVVVHGIADDHPPAVLTIRTSVASEIVAASLAREAIETRRWYAPPLHLHRAYDGPGYELFIYAGNPELNGVVTMPVTFTPGPRTGPAERPF